MADRTAPPPAREMAVHQPLPHDSADLHVAGAATYVDDMPDQYYWVHKRFKTRPPGETKRFYED